MNKFLLATALSVAALAPLAVQAQDINNNHSSFFVRAQLGRGMARISQNKFALLAQDKKSVLKSVSFGWRWDDVVGPEIGYVDLGRAHGQVADNQFSQSLKTKALLLGINGHYVFASNWFASGHAGFMRSNTTFTTAAVGFPIVIPPLPASSPSTSTSTSRHNNGWYAGIGVGYYINKHVSLGLNYDNYHIKFTAPFSKGKQSFNVAAYTASIEYRF